MRKTIFAALAALLLSIAFTACSSSPEDKVVSLMEDAVSMLKTTHIKSADDVDKLTKKMEGLKTEVDKAMTEIMEAYKDKSPEELMSLAKSTEGLEKKIDELSKVIEKEAERLEKEAEDAGLDLAALSRLFN